LQTQESVGLLAVGKEEKTATIAGKGKIETLNMAVRNVVMGTDKLKHCDLLLAFAGPSDDVGNLAFFLRLSIDNQKVIAMFFGRDPLSSGPLELEPFNSRRCFSVSIFVFRILILHRATPLAC
jgi:hypothetical protein